ncbi:MAG: TolC family protein [Janthinobacterium lividum]
MHESIPTLRLPKKTTTQAVDDPGQDSGLSAAFASAQARAYTAHGESRYLLRPQLSFFANYSRISTAFTTYNDYYPHFLIQENGTVNSSNSLGFGVQLTLPLVDMVHRARARESAADAAHALFDARIQQDSFIESRQRLRNSTAELAARAELASLDHDLAQDQLDAIRVRLRAAAGSTGGEQMTPKDELNARLAERQREIEQLNLEQQLAQAEVTLMRQDGSLADWLAATIPGATAAPANATPDAAPPTAPTIGTEPSTAPTTGTTTPGVPTTGTIPSSLPSGPVTNPTPIPTPPSTPHR